MNLFRLQQHGTNVKQEVTAGVTTFVTMAYISVVNPAILSDAGIPFAQAFTATIIAILIGTGLMALYANLPIAVAPGMGLNAFFAYTLVAQQQIAPSTRARCRLRLVRLFLDLIVVPNSDETDSSDSGVTETCHHDRNRVVHRFARIETVRTHRRRRGEPRPSW